MKQIITAAEGNKRQSPISIDQKRQFQIPLMTAKSHHEVISKPYKNTSLQQQSQRSRKTYTDGWHYDSC